MNKNYIAGIVLIAVLFSYNQTSAAIFDWVAKAPQNIAGVVADNTLQFGKIISATQDNDKEDRAPSSNKKETAVPKTATLVKNGIVRTYVVSATAYSSTKDQTDDTPFITAWNTYVRDGIVATNLLPFGTVIKIPEVFGDKLFVVEDRMNQRYKYNIDVWFPDRQSALSFGRKIVTIEVVSL